MIALDSEQDSIPAPTGNPQIVPGGREEIEIEQRKATDPLVVTYRFYDASGRLTDVYLPAVTDNRPLLDDGTTANPNFDQSVPPHWHYSYDARGLQLTQVDPNGHTTTFAYDGQGRRTSRTLPDGESKSWTYDSKGRTKTHKDFDGHVEQYIYDDDFPNLDVYGTELDIPSTRHRSGQLIEERRYEDQADLDNGIVAESTRYGYDDLGRQEAVGEFDGIPSSDPPTRLEITSFDPISGSVTQETSPEGTVNHAYDPATGRLTRTWTASNDTAFGYDSLGRLEHVYALELNGSSLGSYTGWDKTAQEPTYTGTPLLTSYTYDAAGNLDITTLPNGDKEDYDYDSLNRLLTLTVTWTDQDDHVHKLFQQDYTLLDNGQRDYVIEQRFDGTSSTPFSTVKIDWTYDADGRLTQEQRDEGNDGIQNGGDYTDIYTFDLNGNRLSKAHDAVGTADDETITYSYINPSNGKSGDDRLYSTTSSLTGTTTYTYDDNGSTLTITQGSDLTTYGWDLRNRMISATINGTTTTYAYDSDGIRISEGTGSSTTYYLSDKANPTGYSQVVEEKPSPTGAPSLSYIIGNDVIAQAAGTSPSYYLYDGHGSVRGLTDTTGGFVSGSGYEYDAYGDGLNFSIATATSHLLYTGEMADAITGMYDLRAREYQPSIGRFNSFDSAENDEASPQSLHKYLYGSGNPVTYVDPSGFSGLADLMVTMGNIARVGTGLGFGFAGALNIASAGIDIQKAYAASTSDSINSRLEVIGWIAIAAIHTFTGISNVQVARALLFGAPAFTPPPGGMGMLRAAFALAGDNPVLMGATLYALSPAVAGAIANAAGAFLATDTVLQFDDRMKGFLGERTGWDDAMAHGEIAIQPPADPNAPGPDYVTMRINEDGTGTVRVYDAGWRGKPRNLSPTKLARWMPEVEEAVEAMPSGPLKTLAQQAIKSGRVEGVTWNMH